MELSRDLKEFIELLNENEVDYLIVGARAVARYGKPRYTGDLDLFVRRSRKNAERLLRAIHSFGFGELDLTEEDFLKEDQVVQLGVAPQRIDLLTSLTGVRFEEAWEDRVVSHAGATRLVFIGKAALIRNKRALGRPQDLCDLDSLC